MVLLARKSNEDILSTQAKPMTICLLRYYDEESIEDFYKREV